MHLGGVETAAVAIAIVVAAAISALDKFGLLERFGLKNRSSTDLAAELAGAERAVARLREERNKALAEIRRLEQTRSLEPVLDLVAKVADISEKTLDKLGHFNGSLRHVRDGLEETKAGLRDATDGMKALTGVIAELHDLPIKPPPSSTPRRRAA